MAIDLRLYQPVQVQADVLVATTRSTLARLLRTDDVPPVWLHRVSQADRLPLSEPIVGPCDGLFALSYSDLEDEVYITTVSADAWSPGGATISVGKTREPTEYALGLAAAIACGLLTEADIHDELLFWTPHDCVSPNHLLEEVSSGTQGEPFKAACARLLGTRHAVA